MLHWKESVRAEFSIRTSNLLQNLANTEKFKKIRDTNVCRVSTRHQMILQTSHNHFKAQYHCKRQQKLLFESTKKFKDRFLPFSSLKWQITQNFGTIAFSLICFQMFQTQSDNEDGKKKSLKCYAVFLSWPVKLVNSVQNWDIQQA